MGGGGGGTAHENENIETLHGAGTVRATPSLVPISRVGGGGGGGVKDPGPATPPCMGCTLHYTSLPNLTGLYTANDGERWQSKKPGTMPPFVSFDLAP